MDGIDEAAARLLGVIDERRDMVGYIGGVDDLMARTGFTVWEIAELLIFLINGGRL